jgi:Xaa-Pro aminopeptidase
MRYRAIDAKVFVENRKRLGRMMEKHSLAVVNANDVLPMNADAVMLIVPQTDLFYLSGIEQEETILLICPDAFDENLREVLFVRESSELLTIWEGHKLTKEEATAISGIKNVKLLGEFRGIFHRLMCEMEHVYLNSNEHARAHVEVQTRDARFVKDCRKRYPLHDYKRLGRLMHELRGVKTAKELELLREAVKITDKGFRRVARFVKPGVGEWEVEAEFAHEFTRRQGKFAYNPIIASGKNACVLHYVVNDQVCKKGELLLLDVAASYANYNADLTRTIPVDGRFTKRQKQIYNAVLRVMRASIKGAKVGKLHRDWQREAQMMMNEELLGLELITKEDIKKQTKEEPASRKFFNHGLGHFLGLDVHDYGYTTERFKEGTVLTVEPGIYVPKEEVAVRLENDIVVRKGGAEDLMEGVAVEAEEIEELMNG